MTSPATPALRARARGQRKVLRTDIQALRAIAVGSVLLYHLWPSRLPGGFVGVDVFFVISGFLITAHLVQELDKTGRIRLGTFWSRRAIRLLPASLTVLAATAIATVVLVPRSLWEQFLGEIVTSTLYVQNWRLVADSVDYLAAENTPSPVQHFWTLSAEEQFYVMLPLLLVLVVTLSGARARRRAVLVSAITALTALSFAYSLWLTEWSASSAYFSTFTRAWEFGLGAIIALVPALSSRLLSAAVSSIGVAMLIAAIFTLSGSTAFPGIAALLPAGGTALAIWAGRASLLSPLGSLAPIAELGRISYAVYLWHWPLIVLVPFALDEKLDTKTKLLIAIAALVLAWLSTRFVEDPVRQSPLLAAARRPRHVLIWAASAMAVVIAICAAALLLNGAAQEAESEAATTASLSRSECLGAAALDKSKECGDPFAVPDVLVPAATALVKDDDNRAECWAGPTVSELRMCSVGPEKGYERHLIAIGDSHNNTLLGAYEKMAREHNWRIDVAGHAGCYWTDATVTLHNEEATSACTAWRNAVAKKLADDRDIDGYLVTHSSGKNPISDERAAAMATAWNARGNLRAPVISITDNPRFTPETALCVEKDPRAANTDCTLPRATAIVDDGSRRAADAATNAHVVDTADLFCDERTCYPVIGGVIVYRDANHITGSYAKSIAPMLGQRIESILNG